MWRLVKINRQYNKKDIIKEGLTESEAKYLKIEKSGHGQSGYDIEEYNNMDKTLEDKAIDFKGKKYVLVADRIKYFNDTYTNGSITTEMISSSDAERVVFKATVTPDTKEPSRIYTGYSQAKWGEGYINKTAALENCETSAVGRALAMMGIGVIDSVASLDEINKATSPF